MAQPTPQAKPPEVKTVSPMDAMRDTLARMEDEFKKALPPQITPERFIRAAITSLQKEPKLMDANRTSLLAAMMDAAQDGLLLDGRESFINVYSTNVGSKEAPKYAKVCKYMPMVYGIIKKVRNSGELASLTAEVVYKNDTFKYWIDDAGQHVEHSPDVFSDRGERVGVYAMAKTKDGAVHIEPLSKDQVMAVKSKSNAPTSLMWTTFEDEGWKKSAIRRLSKRLPMSTDLETVIRRDDDQFDLDKEAEPEKTKTTSSRLNKIIDATQPKPENTREPQGDNADAPIVDDDELPEDQVPI